MPNGPWCVPMSCATRSTRSPPLTSSAGLRGATHLLSLVRAGDKAVLRVTPFVPLRAGDVNAIGIEGIGLLEFAAPAAVGLDVRFGPARSAQ